ncbi:hypothetical protein EDC37_106165 [Pectinatus cerevisiiphilus]|uniref:Uncharacterized protein n=1 Tax=Pectinatus cerevisiiphilus TaxID=86956 RepID=A0A4R3K9W2_9FIRM|nr:hypothetical protein EDC37_106165 [Pectinatus cerevisiiphilus]
MICNRLMPKILLQLYLKNELSTTCNKFLIFNTSSHIYVNDKNVYDRKKRIIYYYGISAVLDFI